MPAPAVALALLAAVIHAGWNVLAKTAQDQVLAVWQLTAGSGFIGAVAAALVGMPRSDLWPLIAVSSVIQTVYMLTLAGAYQRGDLSFVYPIARGLAPLVVTATGVMFLDDEIGLRATAGVLIVVTALVSLASLARSKRGLGMAVATGLVIASYTTIDATAVRLQGSAIAVIATELVLEALMISAVVAVLRSPAEMIGSVRSNPLRAGVGALAISASYPLAMSATLLAPVGPVIAVRETSVILGVAAGRKLLGEPVTIGHLLAVIACVAGVFLIATG
ncbi:MAG: hypothetical protein OEX04_01660 [Acidimicrobiia bacterium]|nr:hypothetical protein [Acidimicrobiia bacterium]MDH4306161.1 hypothetical protein [Acidimicrobiia bacterium]MDH5292093.1 hypothetical protein [Acidimicrobiia bacterium]